ncbi:MAG: hypothetical protein ABL929_10130 [Ferruginibacter sp.]|nr:hypothetical protein [Ferruginibacter sp.]
MKKILFVLAIGFSSIVSAQTKTETSVPKVKPASTTKTSATVPTSTKSTTVTTSPTGVKLKADGTPDKRYKANTTTSGPKKADGTPDMRYKKNKKK